LARGRRGTPPARQGLWLVIKLRCRGVMKVFSRTTTSAIAQHSSAKKHDPSAVSGLRRPGSCPRPHRTAAQGGQTGSGPCLGAGCAGGGTARRRVLAATRPSLTILFFCGQPLTEKQSTSSSRPTQAGEKAARGPTLLEGSAASRSARHRDRATLAQHRVEAFDRQDRNRGGFAREIATSGRRRRRRGRGSTKAALDVLIAFFAPAPRREDRLGRGAAGPDRSRSPRRPPSDVCPRGCPTVGQAGPTRGRLYCSLFCREGRPSGRGTRFFLTQERRRALRQRRSEPPKDRNRARRRKSV